MDDRGAHCGLNAFTLLEILVAIALMDIIAVALYSSMYTAIKARRSVISAINPYQTVAPAFDRIGRDINAAVVPDGVLAGQFMGDDQSSSDSLSFYSCHYQPDPEESASNIILVEYMLEDDDGQVETDCFYESDVEEDRDQLSLVRYVTTNLLATVSVDPEREVVCRNVVSFDLSYYDGYSWVDSWDSTSNDDALPFGVRVSIGILEDSDGNRENMDTQTETVQSFERVFVLSCAASDEESGGAMDDALL